MQDVDHAGLMAITGRFANEAWNESRRVKAGRARTVLRALPRPASCSYTHYRHHMWEWKTDCRVPIYLS